ncbi:MAG TPA: hypothetical protein VG962_07090 [Steroidobacteraceae bacterium]|nr:hypothetical protein [Steroidobacteraceae bacterium]
MNNRSGKWLTGVLAMLLLAVCRISGAADLQQLVHETQRTAESGSQLTMAWWIPQEFWEASMSNNPNVTEESRTELLQALEDYQIFVVVRARTGIAGISDVQSNEDMISNARFVVDGKTVDPVAPDKLSAGAQTVLASLKPALSGMLGALGQAMQIIVYPSKRDGVRMIDPVKPGNFQYTFYDQNFNWRLPLASLLPNKVDPKTHDEFPGDYIYNPYTGAKLTVKSDNKSDKK